MKNLCAAAILAVSLCLSIGLARAAAATGPDTDGSVIITFKDGHHQSIPASSIAEVNFRSASGSMTSISLPSTSAPSRRSLIGKWQVGEGMGNATFYITLKENGEATKSLGPSHHGTWSYRGGEVLVTWDDGWRDALRKSGSKWQKFAYEPGKSLSDPASNVAEARNTTPQPI